MRQMFRIFIYIIVAGLIFWICHWFLNQIALPEPFGWLARIVLAIAALIVVVRALLNVSEGKDPAA